MNAEDLARHIESLKPLTVVPGSVLLVKLEPGIYSATEMYAVRKELEELFPRSLVMVGEHIDMEAMTRVIYDFTDAAIEALRTQKRPAPKTA